MDRRTCTPPDGDSRVTGSSDSYLGDLVRQRRSLGATGPATLVSAGCATHEWDGVDRREEEISCFDPYLVGLARGDSSDF
jgi:hypothetical protein